MMSYTISDAKEEIKNGIRSYLLKDDEGNYLIDAFYRLPYYLEGKPGIGKTQIVRQVADELNIGFVSFSITHHTRNSLLGLPVIKDFDDGKYTEYTMSEIIASVVEKCKQGQQEGILLLDEFNCAAETVMPTMLAFLQTRNIGHYTLPKGWSIVLCGNPKEYNASARMFDPAILDRVRLLCIEPEFEDYYSYGVEKNFHPIILSYLRTNRENMYYCQKGKDRHRVVTCRGWENLSHALKAYEKLGQTIDEKLIAQFLKMDEIAHSFAQFYTINKASFDEDIIREIIDGKDTSKYEQIANSKDDIFRKGLVNVFYGTLNQMYIEKDIFEMEDINRGVSSVFGFLERLKEGNFLSEQFLLKLNESDIVELFMDMYNPDYVRNCRKFYDVA